MVAPREYKTKGLVESTRRLVLLSRAAEPCSCCCVHEQKNFNALCSWRLDRCFLNCDTKEDDPIPKLIKDEGLPKGSKTKKKKHANISSVYSRSFPSLSNSYTFHVRGTDICSLDPSEQAAYYRYHMQRETRKKATCECSLPCNPRRYPGTSRRHALVSPQVASQTHSGLHIVPVKSRRRSIPDSNKLLLNAEQVIKRLPGGGGGGGPSGGGGGGGSGSGGALWLQQSIHQVLQIVPGPCNSSSGSGSGSAVVVSGVDRPAAASRSLLDLQAARRQWPRSLQSYRITLLQSSTESHTHDAAVARATRKQFSQGPLKTQSLPCPSSGSGGSGGSSRHRGSEYTDIVEEDASGCSEGGSGGGGSSSHCLHRSCHWSEHSTPLHSHLQCFPLAIPSQCKPSRSDRGRGEEGSKKQPSFRRSGPRKALKPMCPTWQPIPPLPINSSGVVFRRSSQPAPAHPPTHPAGAHVIPGMLEGGLRYESLCSKRRRSGNDASAALAMRSPFVTPPS